MANLSLPQGAKPHGVPLRVTPYQAGGTIYPGDLVTLNSAGQIVVAGTSTALCGAAAHYATSGQDVLVFDHDDQLFSIQANGSGITAQTGLNLNYDIVAATADSVYLVSREQLDASTGATTATLPLKAIGIEKSTGNAFGASVKCIVKINNHQLSGGTGTAGT